MKRLKLAPTRRLAHFLAAGGRCAGCGMRIGPGQRWDLDHIVPLSEGGSNGEDNLQVLCRTCHGGKTRREQSEAGKARRRRLRHLGANEPRSTLPGSRRSRWKRSLDGTVHKRR